MQKKLLTRESITNFCYSIGAAIVIMGALFKITHLPHADIMLTVGLVTEACIFIIYAFTPPKMDEIKVGDTIKAINQEVSITKVTNFELTNEHIQTFTKNLSEANDMFKRLKDAFKG